MRQNIDSDIFENIHFEVPETKTVVCKTMPVSLMLLDLQSNTRTIFYQMCYVGVIWPYLK